MMSAPYELQRFIDAQGSTYASALAELQAGHKRGHWMWFIFPQLRGLGRSDTSHFYGITGAAEAKAYLDHPILGTRLRASCHALLPHKAKSATAIFGETDALKLHSSLTLFAHASSSEAIFCTLLDAYFNSAPDPKTLEGLMA